SLQLISAVYSPDGQYIVAASQTAGDLFRFRPDGSNLVNLTFTGDRIRPFANPRFTDDGVWVICTHRLLEPNTIEIYQVLAGGGATRRLTALDDALPFAFAAPNR
ncbi:MAG TPA: hypothetical protein VLB27_01680, partial [candidate division Zixibacteria bacterium]|nr:hypothetical protein [candidate division Zixibacteria bacterium]